MMDAKVSRLLMVVVSLFSLGLILAGVGYFYQNSKVQTLAFAAGSKTGEGYIIGSALKAVVEHKYPKVRINLLETGGTVESLKMIEDGRAQLALAQADIAAGISARQVAILYDDTFQLIVHENSTINRFADLKGKVIGLPRTGGQYQSFLRVADHFGLHQSDFQFVGVTDSAGSEAFFKNQADAIFRVRAIGNPAIQQLVESSQVRIVGID